MVTKALQAPEVKLMGLVTHCHLFKTSILYLWVSHDAQQQDMHFYYQVYDFVYQFLPYFRNQPVFLLEHVWLRSNVLISGLLFPTCSVSCLNIYNQVQSISSS